MIPGLKFAQNDREFMDLVAAVSLQLAVERRLPDWPFRRMNGFAVIYEYDRVLGGSFGRVLEALGKTYCDDLVSVVAFDPSPSYYMEAYQFLPGFRMSRDSLALAYKAARDFEPDHDPTGSLGISLNVFGIVGSSNCWSVWAQRDWEIGLLLTRDPEGPWLMADVPSFSREVDIASIRSPAGWGLPLSDADLATFKRNIREHGSG